MKTLLLLLVLSLFAMPLAKTAKSAPDDPQVSFTGTWKTIAGGTHQYTVILNQTENEVSGSFSPGNGKIFDGIVSGKRLTFKWTQDGGYEGTAEFTMDEDGKGFTGSSTALKPKEFTNTWNTVRPPVISFAGTWETISAGRFSIPLTIVQTGNKVTGIYPSNNGKIEGTVTGRVLRFKWEAEDGSGSGRFVMDESAQSFSGTYNAGDNPDDVDGTWNGKRPVAGGNKNLTPSSFGGVWKAAVGITSINMTLQQSGDQVTGTYQAEVVGANLNQIQQGKVVGNKLTFKVAGPDGSVFGEGEVTLKESGTLKTFRGNLKNFTGNSNGVISGVLIRPSDQ